MTRTSHRRAILLLIVQAWIVPCYGFTYMPHHLGVSHGTEAGAWSSLSCSRGSSRHASVFAGAPSAVSGKPLKARTALPGLSMSDQTGNVFDPDADEVGDEIPAKGPEPFRDEHNAGGNRFAELLARAKGDGSSRPDPPAQPRRPILPEGAPDYENDDEWGERVIGSPDVPDPPLRNEMPGMRMSPEMDYGDPSGEEGAGGGGGGRFQRMMNQAQSNDERKAAGMSPRTSPRSPGRQQPAAPVSRADKEAAMKAAVERQQKLMSKARGIDLDDPTLGSAELAKKKALGRAQAEATTGGYIPSSSAADDYLNNLKADSKRKHKEQQARLRGGLTSEEEPPATASAAPNQPGASPGEGESFQREFVPTKRTKSSFSVQNKADVYMASLKGIKVDLPDNPHMNENGELSRLREQKSSPPVPPTPPPPPQSPSKPPAGPTMTYKEKLRLAREGGNTVAGAPPVAGTAPVGGTSEPAAYQPPPMPPAPPAPMSYAERMKQARKGNDTGGSALHVAPATRAPDQQQAVETSPIPALGMSVGQNAADDTVTGEGAKMSHVMDMLKEHGTTGVAGEKGMGEQPSASAAVQPPSEQKASENGLLGEDATHAKMLHVMDLLTEHKTAGLVGEERVAELRSALADTRETLRAETYAEAPLFAPEATPASSSQRAARPAPPTEGIQSQAQAQQPAPISPESEGTLRRCSTLLNAHVHAPLAGGDLLSLRDSLAMSLAVVDLQVGGARAPVAPVPPAPQGPPGTDASETASGAVPAYVGGMQSVGGVLSDMGVSKKPERFVPENDSGGEKGWVGGTLGDYEKGVATKALGYLLKHRGGKGYGRGRVKGAEAQKMVAALAELTEILNEEMIED